MGRAASLAARGRRSGGRACAAPGPRHPPPESSARRRPSRRHDGFSPRGGGFFFLIAGSVVAVLDRPEKFLVECTSPSAAWADTSPVVALLVAALGLVTCRPGGVHQARLRPPGWPVIGASCRPRRRVRQPAAVSRDKQPAPRKIHRVRLYLASPRRRRAEGSWRAEGTLNASGSWSTQVYGNLSRDLGRQHFRRMHGLSAREGVRPAGHGASEADRGRAGRATRRPQTVGVSSLASRRPARMGGGLHAR